MQIDGIPNTHDNNMNAPNDWIVGDINVGNEWNDMNRHVMYQQFITWDDKVGETCLIEMTFLLVANVSGNVSLVKCNKMLDMKQQ